MLGELISADASGNSTPTVLGGEQQNQPAVPMNMQNLWNFAQKSSSRLVTGNIFSGLFQIIDRMFSGCLYCTFI